MLIDFSNLPIPVDKRITTIFEQLLCDILDTYVG